MIDWNRPLTENEAVFKNMLVESLPPIVARKDVAKYTGGWLSPKTLRNDDSRMAGPRHRYESGRKVLYRREDLVDYGIRRFGVLEKECMI